MLNSPLAFFGETCPDAPKDIAELIMQKYTPDLGDKASLGRINHSWHEVYKNNSFWIESGAESQQEFISRFEELNDLLKTSVCNRFCTLSSAEEVKNSPKTDNQERIEFIQKSFQLSDEEFDNIDRNKVFLLVCDQTLQLIEDGVIGKNGRISAQGFLDLSYMDTFKFLQTETNQENLTMISPY